MKYPQIHTGQVWLDPDTGDTIHIDEVYASDPFSSNEWRAMVRYTVSDGREPDATTATDFGRWIRKYRFTLVENPQDVKA
jgi:hypothetical protein